MRRATETAGGREARQELELGPGMLAELLAGVESRDPSLRGHAERVERLAEAVAGRLGWEEAALAALRTGARLHDVGKIAVPERILCKREPLSPFELHWVRGHPEAGLRLLARLTPLRAALPAVLFHHERWDGGGYPFGVARRQIPLQARLLALADAFDAMTSERPYRPALPLARASAELERCAGTQFDPELVSACLEVWAAPEPSRPPATRASPTPRASSACGGSPRR